MATTPLLPISTPSSRKSNLADKSLPSLTLPIGIADYLSGDEKQTFADMMSQKAHAIGMTANHFVTSNGLHDPNHYSTACDMAKLTTSLERPDTRLIIVVMHSLNGQTRFRDTKKLLDWATEGKN